MNDLPNPEEQAAQLREHHEGGGFGPTHDAIVEARIEADWGHQKAMRMAADLDAVADDLGLFPDAVYVLIRDAQRRLREVAEWMERFANALDAEQEALVEEHEEGEAS